MEKNVSNFILGLVLGVFPLSTLTSSDTVRSKWSETFKGWSGWSFAAIRRSLAGLFVIM